MSWREEMKGDLMQAGRAGGSLARPSRLLRFGDETGQDKTRSDDTTSTAATATAT